MKIKSIKKLGRLDEQKVFLRVDFNVPIKNGKIFDDYKIQRSLMDIRFLLAKGAKIILATHLGEPNGRKKASLSTKPLALHLKKLLRHPVKFGEPSIAKMKKGEIVLLENLRFNPGEHKNDQKFAKHLASLADIYINNAFAVSHRSAASVSAIKKFLPAYAGLLLEQEIESLHKIAKAKKPSVAVIGGQKIATKISVIKNFLKTMDKILIGGALANDFLAAQGFKTGVSKIDKASIKIAKDLLKQDTKKKIVLPVDYVVMDSSKKGAQKISLVKKPGTISKTDFIGDIGPETIFAYSKIIKKAQTIIWNGPMGLFEQDNFRHGTVILGRVIATRASGPAYGVAGGGETESALHLTKMGQYMDWISTGGGAMLEYLSGNEMPGLQGIVN